MPSLIAREVAIGEASIMGRVRAKPPVISATLAREVSGAQAAAMQTAPMATASHRAGLPAAGPNRWRATSPKATSQVALANSGE